MVIAYSGKHETALLRCVAHGAGDGAGGRGAGGRGGDRKMGCPECGKVIRRVESAAYTLSAISQLLTKGRPLHAFAARRMRRSCRAIVRLAGRLAPVRFVFFVSSPNTFGLPSRLDVSKP